MSNRIIKFRAWDEQKKIMHYNFQFIKSGDDGNDWIVFMADGRNFTDSVKDPYFSQQLKLMQFTGLYDKNNKEIYEGDIVRYIQTECCGETVSEYTTQVKYENYGFTPMKYNMIVENDDFYSCEISDIEIIGNIHQNPELLNEKK